MSDIFSKTVIIKGIIDKFECVFTSQFSHPEKMYLTVILPYTDAINAKFVNSIRLNECTNTMSKYFTAEFVSIFARDKGLELLFECDYEIFKYVVEKEGLL